MRALSQIASMTKVVDGAARLSTARVIHSQLASDRDDRSLPGDDRVVAASKLFQKSASTNRKVDAGGKRVSAPKTAAGAKKEGAGKAKGVGPKTKSIVMSDKDVDRDEDGIGIVSSLVNDIVDAAAAAGEKWVFEMQRQSQYRQRQIQKPVSCTVPLFRCVRVVRRFLC